MKVRVFEDPAAVAGAAADLLAGVAARLESPVLALPTGRTVIPFYDELRRRHGQGALDLSRARAFNLDELVLPRDHPASFFTYMERHAWERIGLPRGRCRILDGQGQPGEECQRYDREIEAAGGFDLAVLGVGGDGHVAYNLPGSVAEETHPVELPEAVAESLGVGGAWRPLKALTIGMGHLRRARRLLLIATGATKLKAIRALREGPGDPGWPCTLLREHPRFDVFLDRPAAGGTDP